MSKEVISNLLELLIEYDQGTLIQNNEDASDAINNKESLTSFIFNNIQELESSLRSIIVESECYRILPKEIRDFLESSPETMFEFIRRLNEAVSSREKIHRLSVLMESMSKDSPSLSCYQCNYFLAHNQIREVLREGIHAELSR